MEPQFTQAISSRFVCDYLYFYFILVCVVAGLSLISTVGAVVLAKGSLVTKILFAVPNLLVLALAVLMSMSLYIICERGLRPEESSNKGGRSAEGYTGRR
jgi:hypothetical protein